MTRASRFEGTIGRTVADSEAWFDEPPHPGADAPNVVVVLLDDTGFAQFGCYGSDIDTPNIDALAADGLQFTNFHVTPLCSPTRASLLTGRSQHAVGMRAVSNFRTGFPNMLGHISNHAATVAEVLREEGYATFCVGKWHLAPMEQCSAAGPFDQWPLARGFDRFYGFLEGETDQFHPELVCDNHLIAPPGKPEDGYHLSEDLIDQLLAMVSDSKGVRPDRPFFAYVPFGATHAPHQAPASYMEKYRGKFDEGWDVARQRWFERQLASGVVPEGTRLAPRNPGVDAWDDLPENQKRLACRLQEAFAAFLDHTDDQIGRLVDGLRDMGQLDNTVLVVLADNGASQEGGPYGVMHEMKFFNGIFETPDEAVRPNRRHRRPAQPHQLPVGLGPGRQHPVQVVQAEHPRGRRPRPDDHPRPRSHPRRPGRHETHPVRQRVRHRADDLRPRRRHATRHVSRHRAAPRHRPIVRSRAHRRGRAGDEHPAVLRDGRQPGTGRPDRRHGVEGGVQARQGRRLRHRAMGAVPPRRRLVGVRQPRRAGTDRCWPS